MIVNPSDEMIGLEAAAGILDRVGGDLLELVPDYQHPISDQARQKLLLFCPLSFLIPFSLSPLPLPSFVLLVFRPPP